MAKTEAQKEANRRWYHNHKERLAADESHKEKRRQASKRHRDNNPGKEADKSRRYVKNNRTGAILRNAKSRAKNRGHKCTIDKEWVEKRLAPMQCEVTGVKLEWSPGSKHPLLPSLDRIDPNKGYTPENTRVTSWIFNRARGTFSDQEVLDYIVKPLAN